MPVALSLWLVVTGSGSYRKHTHLFFKISLLCKARDLSLSPQPVAGLPKRLFAPRSSVPHSCFHRADQCLAWSWETFSTGRPSRTGASGQAPQVDAHSIPTSRRRVSGAKSLHALQRASCCTHAGLVCVFIAKHLPGGHRPYVMPGSHTGKMTAEVPMDRLTAVVWEPGLNDLCWGK